MKHFRSPGSFAVHLAKLAALGPAVTHHMVDRGAREVEVTAKGMIGFYQKAAGPFPAWAPLAESTEADKERAGYERGAPLLRTGHMRDTIVRSVEGNQALIGATDPKAVYHEQGTATIPPRPFIGPAALHSTGRIKRMAMNTTVAWVAGLSWKNPRRFAK